MSRLPIRWRVTLAFAATLLVVLGAVGLFLYLRFDHDLAETMDRGLRARAGEVRSLVRRSPEGVARGEALAVEDDESVAQVLRADGTVIASTAGARTSLLSAGRLREALRGDTLFDRPEDDAIDEELRVLAASVRARGEELVTVVGTSREENDEAVSTLLALELLGLGAALVLASAAGYFVVGAALRPMEAMRRRADEITDDPGARLPEPPVDDEVGRLAVTLNAMLDRLDAAQAGQRRFVADASHELRTPLAILKAEIDVALLRDRSAEELRAALRSTGDEADRLVRLAEDLLLLSRSDEGTPPPREQFALDPLLGDVAERADAPVHVEAATGLTIRGDRAALERALVNLVENALTHGAGDVVLSARTDEEALRIAVRDHGPGFDPGFAPHAFERFTRGDAARTGGGAGLGLSIVEAVARAHGGSATVSGADPGARVELVLPAGLTVLSSTRGHPAES